MGCNAHESPDLGFDDHCLEIFPAKGREASTIEPPAPASTSVRAPPFAPLKRTNREPGATGPVILTTKPPAPSWAGAWKTPQSEGFPGPGPSSQSDRKSTR